MDVLVKTSFFVGVIRYANAHTAAGSYGFTAAKHSVIVLGLGRQKVDGFAPWITEYKVSSIVVEIGDVSKIVYRFVCLQLCMGKNGQWNDDK